jgi:hypothetical protein
LQDAKQSLKQFSALLSSALNDVLFQEVVEKACRENPWFTQESIRMAVSAWVDSLSTDAIQRWLLDDVRVAEPKKVGLILAGNIPLVGLHDLLAVLVSNHQAYIKPASDDTVLIQWVMELLGQANAAWQDRMVLVQKMSGVDALIATGSNNSSRYFEYYFRDIPHIIRKNRNSVAVLTGNESDAALRALGDDVFSYYGLGCRNVSKVYLPEGFDPRRLLAAWDERVHELRLHNRFLNNFEYNLALLMVNRVPHLSNNALILQASAEISSPLSVLHYEFYNDLNELSDHLIKSNDLIQCILSEEKYLKNALPFGTSQVPALWDYADGVNTLQFLQKL